MKRFHNDFIIERLIREESREYSTETMNEIQSIRDDIGMYNLTVTNGILRKLIEIAKLELSVAKDKEYYGKQLDGLYIAQAYVDRLRNVERMY